MDDHFEATELKPLIPVEVKPEDMPADDDSQRVAIQAMIQLGNASSYLNEPPVHVHGLQTENFLFSIEIFL